MNDTSEAVQNIYQMLLMRRSGSERLHMGCAMFDTSRAFVRVNLRVPSHDNTALRVGLVVRTYGADFDPATVQRIAEWLSTPHRVVQ